MFLSIFLFNIVSADPPETQVNVNTLEGIDISFPKFSSVPVNEPFNLSVHAYNVSTGLQLEYPNINCELEIYNHTGFYLLEEMDMFPSDDEFFIYIGEGNFTTPDVYSYNIYCTDDTTIGGFIDGLFEVTYIGRELQTSQAILDSLMFLVIFFLFPVIIFGIGKLPDKNTKDEEGTIIRISYLKYFRSVLWFFLWMMIVAVFYISSSLGFAYLPETLTANFLFMLFRITMGLTLPIIVVWLVWIFAQIIDDKKIKAQWNRGLFPHSV